MATPDASNAIISQLFHEGMIVENFDLQRLSEVPLSNLLHLLAFQAKNIITGEIAPGVIDGMACAINSSNVDVDPGLAVSYEDDTNTEAFDYEHAKFVYNPATESVAMPAVSSYPRVDTLYVTPDPTSDESDSRTIVDTTGTPTYTPTAKNHRRTFIGAYAWFSGSSGSTDPATGSDLPANAIVLCQVLRVSAGVNELTDLRRPFVLSPTKVAYPSPPMTRQGFLVPDEGDECAVSTVAGLVLQVASGTAVCQPRLPVRVAPTRVTAGSDGSNGVWSYITVASNSPDEMGFATVNLTSASPGASYSAPGAGECRLASVYVGAGSTTPDAVIDERRIGQWFEFDKARPQSRLAANQSEEVHFYLTSVTHAVNTGYLVLGRLQYADGRDYNPNTDGQIAIRVEQWFRAVAVSVADGAAVNYNAYEWVKHGLGSGDYAIGIGTSSILSDYQSPHAVWTNGQNSSTVSIHLRFANSVVGAAQYDRMRIKIDLFRNAQDRNDGSAYSGDEFIGLAQADRIEIVNPPGFMQTSCYLEWEHDPTLAGAATLV